MDFSPRLLVYSHLLCNRWNDPWIFEASRQTSKS